MVLLLEAEGVERREQILYFHEFVAQRENFHTTAIGAVLKMLCLQIFRQNIAL